MGFAAKGQRQGQQKERQFWFHTRIGLGGQAERAGVYAYFCALGLHICTGCAQNGQHTGHNEPVVGMRGKIKGYGPFVAGGRQQNTLGQFGGHIGGQLYGIGQNARAFKARGQAVALGNNVNKARSKGGQKVPHSRIISQFQA